jgi:aminoglycoside 3-N-acetyltransferase
MDDTLLFTTAAGVRVTRSALGQALLDVGAADCDVLFVHSGLGMGLPNRELGRTPLLSAIWETFLALQVATICVPTFTFSFPNGENYDRERSRTRMGALNEYVRQRPGVVRSVDPIMSVALLGTERALVDLVGKHSCGPDSTYDLLHRRGGGVTFLFLGVRCHECFTFSHYVEASARVPFRYHRPFSGTVTVDGRTWQDTYFHYARYNGTRPVADARLEQDLLSSGHLRRTRLGDGWVSAIDEPAAFATIMDRLRRNPFYLAERSYDANELGDTRFLERNITAL